MEATTQIVIATMVTCGVMIVLGTMVPSYQEGRAVVAALEAMARQPGAADDIRITLFISLAMLESCAIYVLLICFVLLFANPLFAYLR